MDEHWRIYTLIFAAVFLALQGIRGILGERVQRRHAAVRFASIEGPSQAPKEVELLKARSARADQAGRLQTVRRWIAQSGTNYALRGWLVIYAVVTILLYPVARKMGQVTGGIISAAVAFWLIAFYLNRQRSRRRAKFGEQLPDVIDVIVRSLRAGHPIPVSMALVGREMPSPAGPEFTLLSEEISYGRDFREALENLEGRVGHPDLKFLITSISIARQTGGNLAEILSRLSQLIRERFKLKRKVRALSAEGRFGGYILSVVPVLVFALINAINPEYYREFWGHPTQNAMLALAVVMLIIGNLVIYKMVNFKV